MSHRTLINNTICFSLFQFHTQSILMVILRISCERHFCRKYTQMPFSTATTENLQRIYDSTISFSSVAAVWQQTTRMNFKTPLTAWWHFAIFILTPTQPQFNSNSTSANFNRIHEQLGLFLRCLLQIDFILLPWNCKQIFFEFRDFRK